MTHSSTQSPISNQLAISTIESLFIPVVRDQSTQGITVRISKRRLFGQILLAKAQIHIQIFEGDLIERC